MRTPNGVHAKRTTKAKAQAQVRLLNAIDHGWKPTGGHKKYKGGRTGDGDLGYCHSPEEMLRQHRRMR